MTALFSLEDLSNRVNAWCRAHGIRPLSGQAGEAVTERNIRYYRTLGLVDAPLPGGYGERHFLQILAIRILQARGLPLRRIRELLYGRPDAELRELQRRGAEEALEAEQAALPVLPSGGDQLWRMTPLDGNFLLVSRDGTALTAPVRAAVLAALAGLSKDSQPTKTPWKTGFPKKPQKRLNLD